MSFMRSSSL